MTTTAAIIKANAATATTSNTSFVPAPNSSSPQAVAPTPVVKENAVKTTTSTSPSPVSNSNGFVLNADGSTNYQASLDAIKTKALELQTKAQGLSAQNDTPASSTSTPSTIISSSATQTAAENKTLQDLNQQTADSVAITNAHNEYLANLKAEADALEIRRANEEASINAQFDTAKTKAADAQTKETGTFTSTLARIGGYLGESASAAGAMINLNQKHQFQMNDLESKRQAALSEARNAISEKQFAIARLKSQEAKDYAKAIADNKQQFFENNLKILNEQRQQDAQTRLEIKDKLANLAYLEPSQISPETKKEIDQFYGTPGFTDAYINVSAAANKAKNQSEVLKVQKDMLDLLQAIPAGQKIAFPDGTEYTGMGKAGDVSTFMQVDNAGNGHLVTYNKLTGATNVSNLGLVGKSSGGGAGGVSIGKTSPVVIDNAVNIFQTSLEQSKDNTGQYDPDVYLKLRNLLKESSNPQLVPYMDNLFLDKNNEFFSDAAISRLREKGVFYGSVSLPPESPVIDSTGNDVTAGD